MGKERQLLAPASLLYNRRMEIDRYVYHMTRVENLDSILRLGLLSHNLKTKKGLKDVEISNQDVLKHDRTIFGKHIHDYVRFYLNPKNPMLFWNKSEQKKIAIIKVDIIELAKQYGPDCLVISDGNAVSKSTKFKLIKDLKPGFLDIECIYNKKGYWNNYNEQDDTGKRKRNAELLLDQALFPIQNASAIIVMTDEAKAQVDDIVNKSGIHITVEVNPNKYFL